jgi:hypothetical protein
MAGQKTLIIFTQINAEILTVVDSILGNGKNQAVLNLAK